MILIFDPDHFKSDLAHLWIGLLVWLLLHPADHLDCCPVSCVFLGWDRKEEEEEEVEVKGSDTFAAPPPQDRNNNLGDREGDRTSASGWTVDRGCRRAGESHVGREGRKGGREGGKGREETATVLSFPVTDRPRRFGPYGSAIGAYLV